MFTSYSLGFVQGERIKWLGWQTKDIVPNFFFFYEKEYPSRHLYSIFISSVPEWPGMLVLLTSSSLSLPYSSALRPTYRTNKFTPPEILSDIYEEIERQRNVHTHTHTRRQTDRQTQRARDRGTESLRGAERGERGVFIL